MKINDSHLQGLSGTQAGGVDRSRQPGQVGGSGGGVKGEQRTADGDRVQLSGVSQALRAEGEESPERLARVDQLREAVQRGEYRPEAGAISKSIVDGTLLGE